MPWGCGDDMTCGDFLKIFSPDSLFLGVLGTGRCRFVGPKVVYRFSTPGTRIAAVFVDGSLIPGQHGTPHLSHGPRRRNLKTNFRQPNNRRFRTKGTSSWPWNGPNRTRVPEPGSGSVRCSLAGNARAVGRYSYATRLSAALSMCSRMVRRAREASPVSMAATMSRCRSTLMFLTPFSCPANMMDIRMEPSKDSQE